MNNTINFKNVITLSLGIGVLIWITLVCVLAEKDFLSLKAFKLIPSMISIVLLLWSIFVRWLWRTKIFRGWLIYSPDLSGEWEGEIAYVYPKKKDDKCKKVTAIIKQSLFNFSIIFSTDEMESNSYAYSFLIDSNKKAKKITYIYTSEPDMNLRGDSPIHNGAAVLRIDENNPNILRGEYWTGRKTVGEIELSRKK